MSDLISRSIYKSKLLKALDVLNKEYREAILNEDSDLILAIQNQQSAYMLALRLLDNEPAAYDIDKVVEELETNKQNALEVEESIKEYNVWNKAIEIVKQGGVSDDVCEWKRDDMLHTVYKICGGCFTSAYQKDFKYCPYCGKKIKVVE